VFDEMGFGFTVEFAFVDTVGLAAMNRREPSLGVVFADIVDCLWMTADVLTDCRISEPVVSFQQDACACVVLSSPFTTGNEPFQCLAVFLAEIDDIFLSSHSCRYALRGDNVILSRLKLQLDCDRSRLWMAVDQNHNSAIQPYFYAPAQPDECRRCPSSSRGEGHASDN